MNALVDTNVWLDVFLAREPFATTSGRAISILDGPEYGLFAGATTMTTIFYLVEKYRGRTTAFRKLRSLLDRCRIAPVDESVLGAALKVDFDDYEDAVLHATADAAGLEAILTRNPGDFAGASLRIFTPEEFVAIQKS